MRSESKKKHVIDTSAFIAIARKKEQVRPLLKSLESEASVYTTAVSYYEFIRGANPSDSRNQFLETYPVLGFDKAAAQHASAIFQKLQTKGISISPLDVLIAGICQANQATLHTLDKDFEKIPGFSVVTY